MSGFETEISVIAASVLRLATPLILAAIGGLFAERAGVADLGLEGKMLVAAFTAAAVAAVTDSALAGILSAIVAATLLSLLHFTATVWKQGDQIVSGMAINILAGGLVPTLAYALFPLGGITPPLSDNGRLLDLNFPFSHWAASTGFIGQVYATVLGGHSILIYVAFLAAPGATYVLYRTGWGLRLRRPVKTRRPWRRRGWTSCGCACRGSSSTAFSWDWPALIYRSPPMPAIRAT